MSTTGFDASVFQRVIDWAAVKASGSANFAYARASDGPTYSDPYFQRNHDVAKERGIPLGAYHFWRYDADPQAQARHFLALTKDQGRFGPLLPMIDVEEQSFSSMPDLADVVARMSSFINAVEATLNGKKMLVYTNYDTWQRFLKNTPAFKSNPLWLAQTENPNDGLYGGWSDWLLWQDGTATIDGIQGPVDFDILNPQHSLSDLFR